MSYFRSDQKFIYLDAPYCEFYIPMNYFDNGKFAEDLGKIIKTIGIFNVKVFSENKEIFNDLLKIPTTIEIFVNDFEIRTIDLPGYNEPVLCKVLKYVNGSKIMPSFIIEDSENAKKFLEFILSAKLPSIIPYNESLNLWRKNLELNNTHLSVPSVILELILSGAYRYKKDPTIKFSKIIGQNNTNVTEYDYIMCNIRQICQFTSTFTALTFEDMDTMITSSINRTLNHKKEMPTPVEEIIKM